MACGATRAARNVLLDPAMLPRAVSAALVLACASPALAQSSAAFPDLPKRTLPAPSVAAPDRAAPERGAASDVGLREPVFGAPPTQLGGSPGFSSSAPPSPSPVLAPSFAPAGPTHDVVGDDGAAARPSSTLLVVGGLVLGLPYATGVGIGASEGFENGSGWLVAPVAGPWLSLSARRDPCAQSQQKQEFDSDVGKCVAEPLVRGMLVLDGVLQATGAVLMLIGATSGGPDRPRREPPPLVAAPAPMGRSGYGLAVAGGF